MSSGREQAADLIPIYQPPSTNTKSRPRLAWNKQEVVVISTKSVRIGNAEMSQVFSTPIRQGTGRCPLWRQLRSAAVSVQPRCVLVRGVIQLARQTSPSLGPREYSISQWDQIGHSPSWSTSRKRSAASADMRLPLWHEISLHVAEGGTWQRLMCVEELNKGLTFGNTISAANLAGFRTKDAGQFHRTAKLQS